MLWGSFSLILIVSCSVGCPLALQPDLLIGLHFFQSGGDLESVFLACSDGVLPLCPSSPCRVLIPQYARVYEPEWDGDGGGLLIWRSAAAIATWGLLSFNQTKPDDECALLGELGEGERGGTWLVKRGAGEGGAPRTCTFHAFLPRHKKGLPAVPIYHSSRGDWAGEARRSEARVRSYTWWVSSGTQKIKHLILN